MKLLRSNSQNNNSSVSRRRTNALTVSWIVILLALSASSGNSINTAPASQALTDFPIGEISPQSVWGSRTVNFKVHSNEAGPNPLLSFNAVPQPMGPMTLDSSTGIFSYTRDPADRRPFVVNFKAASGGSQVSQSVTFQPVLLDLPAEFTSLGSIPSHAVPDADDRQFTKVTDTASSTQENFNGQMRNPRTISIIGKVVTFQPGNPNKLWDLSANNDIKSIIIEADVVIVRSVLYLPATNVLIRARELRFDDLASSTEKSCIITTPQAHLLRPAEGQDGAHGVKAGDVTLYLKQFTGTGVRLVLTGGNGQAGGLGRDGVAGIDLPEVDGYGPNWAPGPRVYDEYRKSTGKENPVFQESRGVQAWPGNGADSVAGGKAGNAGSGGSFRCNLGLSNQCDVSGGIGGEATPAYHGGRAGTPTTAYWDYTDQNKNGWYPHVLAGPHTSTAGQDAAAKTADIAVGPAGTISTLGEAWAWMSPSSLAMTVAHARICFLYRQFDFAKNALEEQMGLLAEFQSSSEWTALPEQSRLDFTAAKNEMQTMLYRLANHLDYWGNPLGYVPMLSLEGSLLIFDKEVADSIQIGRAHV